jgi:hypothetical protein
MILLYDILAIVSGLNFFSFIYPIFAAALPNW